MAGDRGRKAFAAHLIAEELDSEEKAFPVARPASSVMTAQALPSVEPQVPAGEDAPDEEQMCDVLSEAEPQQQLTELLITSVPTLTGHQILGVRQGLLECARKHGWVDI